MSEYTRYEYAVEVPGRGYYGVATGLSNQCARTATQIVAFPSAAQAEDSAEELRGHYIRYRADELAKQVRVVRRTVVETRTEFAPMTGVNDLINSGIKAAQKFSVFDTGAGNGGAA